MDPRMSDSDILSWALREPDYCVPPSKEICMNTVTFSAFKTNIESTIQSIVETHQPVVVKKNRRSSVIVMPLEDYRALTETKYLLSSPTNAARLVRGIEEIEDMIAHEGK